MAVTIEVARETALATFAARTESCAVSMSCWPVGVRAVVEAVRDVPADEPAAANPPDDAAEGAAAAMAGAELAAGAAASGADAADELEAPFEQPATVAPRMRIRPQIPAAPSERRRAAMARELRMPLGRHRRTRWLRREVTIRPRMGRARLDDPAGRPGRLPRASDLTYARRPSREQLAGDSRRRAARAVLQVVGARRSVRQHHGQPGRALLRHRTVAVPAGSGTEACHGAARRPADRRRGHGRGGDRAQPADEPRGGQGAARRPAARGDRAATPAAGADQAEPRRPRAPPRGQAAPGEDQAGPPVPRPRRLTGG